MPLRAARISQQAWGNMHVNNNDVVCNLQSVCSVQSKTAKGKGRKESVALTEMAWRVKTWGIMKPLNAKHSACPGGRGPQASSLSAPTQL